MTCNPQNVVEIPGSYNACQILIVRECLSVNGMDCDPRTGDGAHGRCHGAGQRLGGHAHRNQGGAARRVDDRRRHGGVPRCRSRASRATTHTDGVTMTGDGSLATPIALLAVQRDASLAGAGTVASPARE